MSSNKPIFMQFVQIFWFKLFLSYYHTTFNLCYDDIFILELNTQVCNVSGWPGWKVWTHLSSSHSYIFSKFSNMPIMLNWKQTERWFVRFNRVHRKLGSITITISTHQFLQMIYWGSARGICPSTKHIATIFILKSLLDIYTKKTKW